MTGHLYKFSVLMKTEGLVYAKSEKQAINILLGEVRRLYEESGDLILDGLELAGINEINEFDVDYEVYGTCMSIKECLAETGRQAAMEDAA